MLRPLVIMTIALMLLALVIGIIELKRRYLRENLDNLDETIGHLSIITLYNFFVKRVYVFLVYFLCLSNKLCFTFFTFSSVIFKT